MALSIGTSLACSSSRATQFLVASCETSPTTSGCGCRWSDSGLASSSRRRQGSAVHSSRLWGDARQFGSCNGEGKARRSKEGRLLVRAKAEEEVVKSKGMAFEGPGRGGQWLSSTTRHVRLYIGVIDPATEAMDQSQLDKVTLMLDPDNEFTWTEDKVQKVYDYFAELVKDYAGAPMEEYTLRLIGSDIEHYIRKLLLANEIKYNLDCRVLNFSMGKPHYDPEFIEAAEE